MGEKTAKIAASHVQQFREILKTAADCLERVTAERDAVMEELKKQASNRQIEEIKTKMAAAGVNPYGTEADLERELQKKAADPVALSAFREAVAALAPNTGLAKLGELADGPDKPAGSSAQSKAALDSFVMEGGA